MQDRLRRRAVCNTDPRSLVHFILVSLHAYASQALSPTSGVFLADETAHSVSAFTYSALGLGSSRAIDR